MVTAGAKLCVIWHCVGKLVFASLQVKWQKYSAQVAQPHPYAFIITVNFYCGYLWREDGELVA